MTVPLTFNVPRSITYVGSTSRLCSDRLTFGSFSPRIRPSMQMVPSALRSSQSPSPNFTKKALGAGVSIAATPKADPF